MDLIKTFVKRFWLAIVTCTLIMMGGGLSFGGLEWSLEAKRKRNVVTIQTQAKNPTTVNGMEKFTRTLEKKIKTLKGMDYFCSSSDAHKSTIEIFFNSKVSIVDSLKEVGNIVVTVKKPEYVKIPIVQQSSKTDHPLMIINTYSKTIPLTDITRYAKEVISGKLEKIDGVSHVEIKGDPKPEIQVKFLQSKLNYYGVDVDKVKKVFSVYNQEKGFISRQTGINEFSVVANSSIKTLVDIKNVIIDPEKNIKMSNIADITFAQKEFLNENWVNGTTRVVTIKIFMTNEGNPLEASANIKKIMNEWIIKHDLVTYVEDNAEGIREFFAKTKKSFIEAVVITLVIVVLFLGSLKSSITPILAIPISLIATFLPMRLTGCSINASTLMAFLLAIGLVVDDAILVVENITKHKLMKKSGHQAAIDGTKEIQVSIIVMTMTLACVFFPAIFSKGTFGATLKEFAITLSVSVIISGVVSLTLTPSISARMLSHSEFADKMMKPIEKGYHFLLKIAIKMRFLISLLAAFSIVTSGYILKNLPKESVPKAEVREVEIYSINSGNKHLSFFKKQAEIIVKYLKSHPDVRDFAIYMDNSIYFTAELKKEGRPVKEVTEEMLQFLEENIKDVTFVQKSTKTNIVFDLYIYGNLTRSEMTKVGEDFTRALRRSRHIDNAIQYAVSKTGYTLSIDYQKAATIGCNVETVEKVIDALNTRYQISRFEKDGKYYNIVSMTDKGEDLNKLLQSIWNEQRQKNLVKISPSVFAKIIQEKQTTVLSNFNGLPAFKVEVVATSGAKMGELIESIQKIHGKVAGKITELAFTGPAKEFLEDKGEMFKMFSLAAVFIFLILLAQFESLKDTLIVMMTAPLALFGALIIIKARGSINIYSTIAMITLIGLIIKHGILFVNTVNQYLEEGRPLKEASFDAATSRLRPVLMTTFAMSLGLLPLCFETEAYMVKLQQMANILFYGLTIGTCMTLFVIPCLYITVSKEKSKKNDEIVIENSKH